MDIFQSGNGGIPSAKNPCDPACLQNRSAARNLRLRFLTGHCTRPFVLTRFAFTYLIVALPFWGKYPPVPVRLPEKM
ncbi:hypothetical protein J21TS7_10030 [Paenibacillus cineris]|uniref:Uncharacterized protein n=1 Tax=Paenibacillus cineris TaxID=237530 RepID=A0ABQ4L8Q5_9BACL|nr:hypothetical protein J21TS7_10030 [Paenibacillus cineris]